MNNTQYAIVSTVEKIEFIDSNKQRHIWETTKTDGGKKSTTKYEGPKDEYTIPGDYKPNLQNFQESIDFIQKLKNNL